MPLGSCVAVAGVGQQLQLRFHPLAWEFPYALGVALQKKKKKKKESKEKQKAWNDRKKGERCL